MSWGARLLDALDSEGRVKADHRRRVAVALAAYATADGRGRGLGDPVHEMITEGRRKANEERRLRGSPEVPYYSCCDLAHWMLACLGCTDETLVNRGDDGGEVPWRVSVNFSRLRGAKAFFSPRYDEPASPGDILLIDHAGGHAAVVRSWDEATGVVVTENYGGPYAHRKTQHAVTSNKGWLLDGSKILGWVDIEDVSLDGPARLPEVVAEAVDG